jgi:predicted RNA-binding protein YlxR (DUF448 family)
MKTLKANIRPQAVRKHVPRRTCIACREVAGKRELVRLAASSDGVVIDTAGRMPGRGVYLCPVSICWEKALKGNRIEYGLRTRLSAADRQTLAEYGRSLPEKEE